MWVRASAIGRLGGAFWTALWVASMGVVDGVGGLMFCLETSRVQWVCTNGQARSRRVGLPQLGGVIVG
jgi:hypothetical protein